VAKLKYSYNAAGVMGHVEQIASCTAFDKRLHVLSNVTSTCVYRGVEAVPLNSIFSQLPAHACTETVFCVT